MASKWTKPARLACGTGPELHCLAADADRANSTALADFQASRLARLAVDEMVAAGARFTVTRRDDGTQGFLYGLPHGGDQARCRALIREAKDRGGAYWDAFHQTVIERAGGAS